MQVTEKIYWVSKYAATRGLYSVTPGVWGAGFFKATKDSKYKDQWYVVGLDCFVSKDKAIEVAKAIIQKKMDKLQRTLETCK